jgi:hypothetical protein
MNMSNTPFTNIETCNGELDAQAADDRSPRYAPPRLRDYYAYGVILCHSTYRKLIEADTKVLRDDFEPDMLTKPLQPFLRFKPNRIYQVSTLLEILGGLQSFLWEIGRFSVSTLLEILDEWENEWEEWGELADEWEVSTLLEILGAPGSAGLSSSLRRVSTLLEILGVANTAKRPRGQRRVVSTLLEIQHVQHVQHYELKRVCKLFQPFLRFNRKCASRMARRASRPPGFNPS